MKQLSGHPPVTHAWRFYPMVSGQNVAHDPALVARLRVPAAVPTTSIYSKTDGIVAWQCSLNEGQPHTENMAVLCSLSALGAGR